MTGRKSQLPVPVLEFLFQSVVITGRVFIATINLLINSNLDDPTITNLLYCFCRIVGPIAELKLLNERRNTYNSVKPTRFTMISILYPAAEKVGDIKTDSNKSK